MGVVAVSVASTVVGKAFRISNVSVELRCMFLFSRHKFLWANDSFSDCMAYYNAYMVRKLLVA